MNRKQLTLAAALTGAVALNGPALAQGAYQSEKPERQGQQAQRQQAQQGQRQGQPGQEQVSEELKTSLQKLHAANQAEIQLGKAAQKQAQSQQVKQFAQQMVQDHQKNDQKLQQISKKMNVQLQGEEFRNAQQESQDKMKELLSQRGAEFDRAYMEHMVSDHQEDIQQVHDAAVKAAEGRHTELAKFLGETEGTLHQHHARAQQTQQRAEQQGQRPGQQAQAGQDPQAQQQPGGIAMGGQEPRSQEQQPGAAGGQPQAQGTQEPQAKGEEPQAKGQEQQASKSVVGTVESVEGDKLSLKNELGETHEFQLGEGTRFTREGRSIQKDQINEGDQVRAAFSGEQGNFKATEISVMKSGQGEQKQEKPEQQKPEEQQKQQK